MLHLVNASLTFLNVFVLFLFVAMQVLDKCCKKDQIYCRNDKRESISLKQILSSKMYCCSCLQLPLNGIRSSRLECTYQTMLDEKASWLRCQPGQQKLSIYQSINLCDLEWTYQLVSSALQEDNYKKQSKN